MINIYFFSMKYDSCLQQTTYNLFPSQAYQSPGKCSEKYCVWDIREIRPIVGGRVYATSVPAASIAKTPNVSSSKSPTVSSRLNITSDIRSGTRRTYLINMKIKEVMRTLRKKMNTAPSSCIQSY